MSPAQSEAYVGDVSGTEKMAQQLGNAAENPQGMVDLQDKAVNAINKSRQILKSQGLANAGKLSEQLSGKYVEVNPQELEAATQNLNGIDPRADELLNHYRVKVNATQGEPMLGEDNVMRYVGGTPESSSTSNAVAIPANEANQLKRYLQEGARFAQGTVTQPQQPAKIAQAAQTAAGLRAGIENVEPQAAALNKQMQDGMVLQQALRQGAKNSPLAFVSSESPDRMATLARAETKGAGGLFDFGNQLGAAKSIVGKNVGSGVDSSLFKAAGRAGLRGVSLFEPIVDELRDFPYLQQLMQSGLPTENK